MIRIYKNIAESLFFFAIFSAAFFLSPSAVSAVGFHMWEKESVNGEATAITESGDYLYVGGYEMVRAGIYRAFIEKRLKANGDVLETSFLPLNGNVDRSYVTSVSFYENNIYVAGWYYAYRRGAPEILKGFVTKFDRNLNIVWSAHNFDGLEISDVIVNGDSVYFSGYDIVNRTTRWIVEKLSIGNGLANGDPVIVNNARPYDLKIKNNTIVIAGADYSEGQQRWRIEERNMDLDLINDSPFFSNSGRNSYANKIALSENQDDGVLFLSGYDGSGWRLEKHILENYVLCDRRNKELCAGFYFGIKNDGYLQGSPELSPNYVTIVKDLVYSSDGNIYSLIRETGGGNRYWWRLSKFSDDTGREIWKQIGNSNDGSSPNGFILTPGNAEGRVRPVIFSVGGSAGRWRIEKTVQDLKAGDLIRATHVSDFRGQITAAGRYLASYDANWRSNNGYGEDFEVAGASDNIVPRSVIKAADFLGFMKSFNRLYGDFAASEPFDLSFGSLDLDSLENHPLKTEDLNKISLSKLDEDRKQNSRDYYMFSNDYLENQCSFSLFNSDHNERTFTDIRFGGSGVFEYDSENDDLYFDLNNATFYYGGDDRDYLTITNNCPNIDHRRIIHFDRDLIGKLGDFKVSIGSQNFTVRTDENSSQEFRLSENAGSFQISGNTTTTVFPLDIKTFSGSYQLLCLDEFTGIVYERDEEGANRNVGKVYLTGFGPERTRYQVGRNCGGNPGYGQVNEGKRLIFTVDWNSTRQLDFSFNFCGNNFRIGRDTPSYRGETQLPNGVELSDWPGVSIARGCVDDDAGPVRWYTQVIFSSTQAF